MDRAKCWAKLGRRSAQVPTSRFCCQTGRPRGRTGLGWEWLRGGAFVSLPTTLGLNLCSSRKTWGIREQEKGARPTGWPEAVQAQRQARSLARAPLTVGARCSHCCRFSFPVESQALPRAASRAAEPGPCILCCVLGVAHTDLILSKRC